MRFRKVLPDHGDEYREAIFAAGLTAETVGAHFWAFEVDDDEGRFVEFLEGADDATLARLDDQTNASLTVGGAKPEDLKIGADGFRCTELTSLNTP
jgi:hypothetical protein